MQGFFSLCQEKLKVQFLRAQIQKHQKVSLSNLYCFVCYCSACSISLSQPFFLCFLLLSLTVSKSHQKLCQFRAAGVNVPQVYTKDQVFLQDQVLLQDHEVFMYMLNLNLKIALFFSTGLFPVIKLSTHYGQRVAMLSAHPCLP